MCSLKLSNKMIGGNIITSVLPLLSSIWWVCKITTHSSSSCFFRKQSYWFLAVSCGISRVLLVKDYFINPLLLWMMSHFDTHWVEDPLDENSMGSSYTSVVVGNLVAYSKKQNVMIRSNAEAKHTRVVHTTCEMIGFNLLLHKMSVFCQKKKPMVMHCDNQVPNYIVKKLIFLSLYQW